MQHSIIDVSCRVASPMSLTRDTHLPSDEELTVPQELVLSTPWLKAVAPYMGKHCEKEANVSILTKIKLKSSF